MVCLQPVLVAKLQRKLLNCKIKVEILGTSTKLLLSYSPEYKIMVWATSFKIDWIAEFPSLIDAQFN